MMDAELAKFFASLGVGGAIAGLIFFFYRRDSQANKEQIIAMSAAHLAQVVDMKKDSDRRTDELKEVVRSNTVAVAENTGVTRAMVDVVKNPPAAPLTPHWKGGR